MGRKSCFGKIVFMCFLCKCQVAIVNVKIVIMVVALQIARIAHVDIQQAISIYVYH